MYALAVVLDSTPAHECVRLIESMENIRFSCPCELEFDDDSDFDSDIE